MMIRALIGITAAAIAMAGAVTAYAQTTGVGSVVTTPPSTLPTPQTTTPTPPGLALPPTASQPRGLPPNPEDRFRVPPAGTATRSTPPNVDDRFRVPPLPQDLGSTSVIDPSTQPLTVPSTGLANPVQPGTVPSLPTR